MLIRPREQADIAPCAELLELVHLADHYPTRWPADPRVWLSPHGLLTAYVAIDRDAIQGHVAVVAGRGDRGAVELCRLFVSPERRRDGVGTSLVDAVVDHAAERGRGLVLEVVEDNSGALEFYERRGFRLTGRETATWLAPDESRPTLARFELP